MKLIYLPLIGVVPLMLSSCSGDDTTSSPASDQSSNPSANSNPVDNPPTPDDPPSNASPVVNVNKLNQDLITALSFGQTDKALEAIHAGATPEATNRYGLPVIFIAAEGGHTGVVKTLIEKGADPNAKIGTSFNDDGVGYTGTTDGTVLGYAAAKGHGQVMYDLVVAGADVNGSGPDGTTPLMQAAEAGKYSIVKWLIDAGADANAKNKHGGTALGMAQLMINPDQERQQIIELLKSKQ